MEVSMERTGRMIFCNNICTVGTVLYSFIVIHS